MVVIVLLMMMSSDMRHPMSLIIHSVCFIFL